MAVSILMCIHTRTDLKTQLLILHTLVILNWQLADVHHEGCAPSNSGLKYPDDHVPSCQGTDM